MFGGAMKLVVSCWRPVEKYVQSDGSEEGSDGIVWFKDIGEHAAGSYSMAVAQANQRIEDHCQVETGTLGTFVGIYDGHGGPDAACFVSDRLFGHLLKVCLELRSTTISHGQKPLQACQLRSGSVFTEYASEQGNISSDAIRKAFLATEEEFLSLVAKSWLSRPQLASVGSCCLVGLIFNSTLYVANLGDSRVVMGRLRMTTRQTIALQLSTEHNASMETVREELQSLHPDDSEVVVLKHGVWRIKGIIQVSRSIGDVYLKRAEFNRDPLQAKFRLAEPLKRPVLSAEPSVTEYKLLPQDRFLIFASDGLWEQLTNQEAVDIVSNHSPEGSAKRLVKAALQVAAKKREMRYADLRNIELGIRRHFHDDITVIVVFLDHNMISKGFNDCPTHSVRSPGI